ncbi:MAG TPA: cytochrome c-type biogenesis CcmF C-terminal domain-containing protein [Bacteroidota bacterium]|nr:cytochrome c-type biogenesis CcmF C-terminal domain-containing protein [Bacteroidota bacterium]
MIVLGLIAANIVRIAFLAALAAAFFYFRSVQKSSPTLIPWARNSYHLATILLLSSSAIFLYLILTHQFQYKYVWEYSSTTLPTPLLMSTFYAGQEGSFTLWALYTSVIGLILMLYSSRRNYEGEAMAVYSLILSFLLLMLVVKNPFTFIWDAFPADLIKSGPIPAGLANVVVLDAAKGIWAQFPNEGRGLNPLLQNYWMVIHPQILFTGFSSMAVPYTLAVAALWKRDYTSWIRVATPWAVFGSMVLGTGIIMGGYWAYETLGWGGFWGWDPVENSSLIPWLICVASIHTALNQRKSGAFVKTNFVFSLLTFLMALYSTFLTRSGVLGDTSVHSFVDPGMWVYWLLLSFIAVFTAIGFGIFFRRRREMPKVPVKHSYFSREFALFLGAFTLSFVALFVAIGTSSPIITSILKGKASAVEVGYYVKTNLPLGIIVGLLSGLGQLLWWKHSNARSLLRSMAKPSVLALGVTLIVFFMLGSENVMILLFTFCSAFSLFSNIQVGYEVFMGNPKFVGGSIAHIGIAIMCLGFVTSSRYDSKTTVSLERGKPVETLGYRLTYLGYKELDAERYAFNVQVEHGDVKKVVSPLMRFNTQENTTIRNPDIINFISRDFYVSPLTVQEGGQAEELPVRLPKGSSEKVKDLRLEFMEYEFSDEQRAAMTDGKEFFIKAKIRVTAGPQTKDLDLLMKSGPAGPEFVPTPFTSPSGATYEFAIKQMMPNQEDPSKSMVEIMVKMPADPASSKEDTLVIEASVKPMINLVWAGTITLVIGFLLTIMRRTEEAKQQGDKWVQE